MLTIFLNNFWKSGFIFKLIKIYDPPRSGKTREKFEEFEKKTGFGKSFCSNTDTEIGQIEKIFEIKLPLKAKCRSAENLQGLEKATSLWYLSFLVLSVTFITIVVL